MELPPIFALRQQNEQWLLSALITQELSCIPITEVTIAELTQLAAGSTAAILHPPVSQSVELLPPL
jgi:hypothetical protein